MAFLAFLARHFNKPASVDCTWDVVTSQLVEELLTFWSLEDYEDTLEELEEALIVRTVCPVALRA
jgi:hypothetical protein